MNLEFAVLLIERKRILLVKGVLVPSFGRWLPIGKGLFLPIPFRVGLALVGYRAHALNEELGAPGRCHVGAVLALNEDIRGEGKLCLLFLERVPSDAESCRGFTGESVSVELITRHGEGLNVAHAAAELIDYL